jgi:tetratricopeptide (TPR) repeat protein
MLLMFLAFWSTGGMVHAESSSVLLEKGIYAEETAGNLDEAMGIYQKIIADEQANRQAAAQAYYRLGKCYQKKGDNAKAVELFQKLIVQYPEQKELIEKVKKLVPSAQPSSVPMVVRTTPEALKNDVSPDLKEITVTFDQPMMDQSWSWAGGGETYPKLTGPFHYNENRTTCIMPMSLEPGKVYWVGINSPSHRNFKNEEGIPARRYVILFATRGADGKPTPIPEDWLAKARSVNARTPVVTENSVEFPQIVGCRVKQTLDLTLQKLDTRPAELPKKELYQGDLLEVKAQADSKGIEAFTHFGMAVLPFGDNPEKVDPSRIVWQGNSFKDAIIDKDLTPGTYRLIVFGTSEKNEGERKMVEVLGEMKLEVLFPPRTQITINEIQTDGTINAKNVVQKVNQSGEPMTRDGFRNSDFVKIEKMFDQDGKPVKFDVSHQGSHYIYQVTLNKPVPPNQVYTGWTEGKVLGMIRGVPGTNDTFEYQMNHFPGGNGPVRRIEIYRLPKGAQLISSTPAEMLRRQVDGQTELVHMEMIPEGGSILTEFRYRLGGASVGSEPAQSDASSTQNLDPAEGENSTPMIAKTTPAALSCDVSPDLKEISVTFSQPIMDQSWSWTGGGKMYPKTTGKPFFNEDRTVYTLPVSLEAGKVYCVSINGPSQENSATKNHGSSRRYVILFATRANDGRPTRIPEAMVTRTRAINAMSQQSASSLGVTTKVVTTEDKIEAEKLAAEGWKLWRERNLAEAQDRFEKALARDPKFTNAWNGLGWSQFQQGMYENAKVTFAKCLALDPNHAAALNGLGFIAKTQNKTDDAIGYWERAVNATPHATASLSGLTQTYMELKQYDKAAKYYRIWLGVEPNNAEAKEGLEKAESELAKAPAPATAPTSVPTTTPAKK